MVTQPISDAGLLERFATHRDEAAFGELVKRHGPQVLRVCRRGLPSEHDVEDVFQATFFVLAHKAATVSWTDSVESWLCAVASRLVLHARASAWQRQSRERSVTTLRGTRAQDHGLLPDQYHPLYDPHEELERRDIRRVLDAALGQLPEKYRRSVVLCYLEGKTNEEAARQLGWPTGTMSRRLQRARSLLRQRLAHCGLMIALAVCAAFASGRSGQPGAHQQSATISVVQAMQSLRDPEGTESTLECAGFSNPLPTASVPSSANRRKPLLVMLGGQPSKLPVGRLRRTPKYELPGGKMRLAALDMGRAATTGNRAALLGAARQLDATCIGCHEIFRH